MNDSEVLSFNNAWKSTSCVYSSQLQAYQCCWSCDVGVVDSNKSPPTSCNNTWTIHVLYYISYAHGIWRISGLILFGCLNAYLTACRKFWEGMIQTWGFKKVMWRTNWPKLLVAFSWSPLELYRRLILIHREQSMHICKFIILTLTIITTTNTVFQKITRPEKQKNNEQKNINLWVLLACRKVQTTHVIVGRQSDRILNRVRD